MTTKIAKIESTMLGIEDHGIFTVYLTVNYGGSGQSIGGYSLDTPLKDLNGKFIRRAGSAYGMEFIMRMLAACGVDSWEKIKGLTILVYVTDESWNAKVIGIGPLPTEPGTKFLFDELKIEDEK